MIKDIYKENFGRKCSVRNNSKYETMVEIRFIEKISTKNWENSSLLFLIFALSLIPYVPISKEAINAKMKLQN